MPDLPDAAPLNNDRFMTAEEWFDTYFKRRDGKPFTSRTRKKHLKTLGIEFLWIGWTPVVDPAIANRRVLELAAKQNARVTKE